MKILFISHSFPYPPNEGIKLMSYNLLKELSKRHLITLLSLIESEEEKKYIPLVEKFCQRIETVIHEISKSPFKRLRNIFFQKHPFCVYQFYSNEFAQELKQLTGKEKYDIIHFDFINTSLYRNFVKNIPAIFFPHDAMSMLFYRNIDKEKNFFRKFYTYAQWKKMVYYEKETISKFEKTVVVSPKDKEWLLNFNPNFDISVIPNGVDTEYFKPFNVEDAESSPRTQKEDYPSVIFRGIMNFLPNVDAAVYFAKEILPLIRREVPHLKYYIVGPNPTKEIKKLASDPLNLVTGYVEDIRLYIYRAIVNVCPMRIGSGIKNKILEAMAMSKSTVATKLACEGLPDAKDDENILIADTPEEFAEKVILLIRDEKLRKKIGENGRKFVTENYTWEKTAEKFERLYQQAIALKEIKRVSLIIPVYNERKTIENVVKNLVLLNFNGIEKEIILVDDSSNDGTREVLKKFRVESSRRFSADQTEAHTGLKYRLFTPLDNFVSNGARGTSASELKIIFHKNNQGKGAAIRTGLKEATGDLIIIQDADLEYNPQELEKLLSPIIQNSADVVYGSRFLQKNPILYFHYYWGNKLLSSLISLLYGQKVTDAYTCYKVFRKNVLKNIDLKSKRFEFEAEITCKLLKKECKIYEIPISYQPRSLEEGKKISWKDGLLGFWTILKNRFFPTN